MRILILGGDGMLGHQLMYSFRQTHDVKCTLRRSSTRYNELMIFNSESAFFDADIRDTATISRIIDTFFPEVVINCVGIVKQRPESEDRLSSIEVNALAPHKIDAICENKNIRFIHISTDCIFDGKTGGYVESDSCNVSDVYGLTKYLGEIHRLGSLTIRTSIIGHELSRKTGLLEWFLAQREPVRGFTNAVFSGLTTYELANVIEMLISDFREMSGLYHVSSRPICKYDLLCLQREVYELSTTIEPDGSFYCDRSLDSSQFRNECDYDPPEWDAMVRAMRVNYDQRSVTC